MKSFKQHMIIEDSQTYPGMNDETAEEVLDDAIKAGLKIKWQVNKDKSGVDVQVTGPEKKFDKFYKLMNKRPFESGHHGRDPYEPKMLKKYNKYKGKFKAESVNEAHKEIVVPWDMDDPKQYAADFREVGVYVNQWDKRKGTITVDGDEKDLLAWLTDKDAMAMSKGEALKYIKKGKKV